MAPMDYSLYIVAVRYLGQALLEILENGEEVETVVLPTVAKP